MPLSRYLVRNEYSLADPDLYRVSVKDDPEALLESVSMAGLVGVLRQLGDLAEFAAKMFHDLHEEVMATGARGHDFIARLQELEAEFPSAEKKLLLQPSHTQFLYSSGIDWHPNICMEENLVGQSDVPRYMMDSYEECRGPPRLFLLDKFDVAGAGACLKRYTDPSVFDAYSTDSGIKKSDHMENKIGKFKRRGPWWRHGDTTEAFPTSHAKLHQLLLQERLESGENDPKRHMKLKKRTLDGFQCDERLKSCMQGFLDSSSPDYKVVHEISVDLVPLDLEPNVISCCSGVEISTVSPSREPYSDKMAYSPHAIPDVPVKSSTNDLNKVIDVETAEIPRETCETNMDKLLPWLNTEATEELIVDAGSKSESSAAEYNNEATEELVVDAGSKSESSAAEYNNDTASEIDNYEDALATMDLEVESDEIGQQELQDTFLDYHSVVNSSTSHDGCLLEEINNFFCSDIVSDTADCITDGALEGITKSSTDNSLEDNEKSITVEALQNKVEEYIDFDDAESIGNSLLLEAELNDASWSSVKNVEMDKKSVDQAVLHTLPSDGYDHLMATRKLPVNEIADASLDIIADVSFDHSHVPEKTISRSQSDSVKDGEPRLFNEMVNSFSFCSAGNPIDDLRKAKEASSDGLLLFQKSSSVPNYEDPFFANYKKNNLASASEAKSDRLSGLLQDAERPEEVHIAGTSYFCRPRQLCLSEDSSSVSEDVTNFLMISVGVVGEELESTHDHMVNSRILTDDYHEDLSTLAVDHADGQSLAVETHYPPEVMHLRKIDSVERLFDYSEIKAANSRDECSEKTALESTGEAKGNTTMNIDGSTDMNLVFVPYQIHSDTNEVLKIPNAPIFSIGKMAGAGSPRTVANAEGLSKSSPVNEVESDLNMDTTENHNDSLSMDLYQLCPKSVSSCNIRLGDDVSGCLQVEGAAGSVDDMTDNDYRAISLGTVCNDSPSKHISEGNSDLDLFHSVTRLQHVETKVANAGHDCLKVENTMEQRQSLSTVPDRSSISYTNKHCEEFLSVGEDVHETSKGTQMPLQYEDVDLQSPVSPRMDDCVNSDSIICHSTEESFVLRSADSVHWTCLADSVESHQHLERSNFGQHQVVEDEEDDLDALSNAHTIGTEKATDTQDFDRTMSSSESMEGTPQSLEYAQENIPPKICGNEMCFNLTSASKLSAPLSKTMDLPQPSLPLFSTLSDPTHIHPQEMPPLPPLPPVQWRLGRKQHTSLASEGLMQHSFDIYRGQQPPETYNNAGVRSQKSVGAEQLNPFLSFSAENVSFPHVAGYSGGNMEQPIVSTMSIPNMFHEDGKQHSIDSERRQDVQSCMGEGNYFPPSDRDMDDFSFKPSESGYVISLPNQVFQKETTTADDLFEHYSSAQQETTVADEQREHLTEHEIQESPQFEPFLTMQYEHPLPQGFMAREAQGLWSADIFRTIKPENVNHSMQKKIPRPRNPLIDEVVALDKTKLRKVGEIVKSQDKQEVEKLKQNLPQLRKVGERFKPQDAVKAEECHHSFPPLRKVGQRVGTRDEPKTEGIAQHHRPQLRKVVGKNRSHNGLIEENTKHFLQLRKVTERIKHQDGPTSNGNTLHLPQLRKVGERIKPEDESKAEERKKHQDGPTSNGNTLHFSQLRKVGERIKPEDESKAEERKQSRLPLRSDSGGLKSEDEAQAEDKGSVLDQIRNKTFNLKPAVTSRPSLQVPQTNLKVAAILEKASTIRQAMAGSDEEDSDGWSDN